MKQYCRYCASLIVGDVAYCEKKETTMADSTAKTTNKCKDFVFNEMDAFFETEGYKPREKKAEMVGQIRLEL